MVGPWILHNVLTNQHFVSHNFFLLSSFVSSLESHFADSLMLNVCLIDFRLLFRILCVCLSLRWPRIYNVSSWASVSSPSDDFHILPYFFFWLRNESNRHTMEMKFNSEIICIESIEKFTIELKGIHLTPHNMNDFENLFREERLWCGWESESRIINYMRKSI
jgi:hypothetical protein